VIWPGPKVEVCRSQSSLTIRARMNPAHLCRRRGGSALLIPL
jgi:hypothetical protein